MKNLMSKFIKKSFGFIILVSSKYKKGESNKVIYEEAQELESYYDSIEKLIEEANDELHLLKLEKMHLNLENGLLKKELKDFLQLSFDSSDKELGTKFITNSSKAIKPFITKKRFLKAIEKIKNGTPVETLIKNFSLTDTQIIELFKITTISI